LDALVEAGEASVPLPALERNMLAFARDITLRAPDTTRQQVDELRAYGLSDLLILNLVLITASFNAGNRMNRALGGPPPHAAVEQRPARA
jgi:alkylhydroperoxidase family enzyme